MNGGYSMLDFSGVDLGNLGKKDGAYADTKAALATGKPIVINGIVNGVQAFSPIVAYGGIESTTSVFLSFFPVTIHIDKDDNITM